MSTNDRQTKSAIAKIPTTKARRMADRAVSETEKIYQFLDQAPIGYLGVVQEGYPVVLPLSFVRFGDEIRLHGAMGNNIIKTGIGSPVTFTTTIIDGLVLAKLASNHSFNYRSVVIFGELEEVTDLEEKCLSMEGLIDRFYPGRSKQLRKLTSKELGTIRVARLKLTHLSAKERTGPPVNPPEELYPNAWVGTIDLETVLGRALPDSVIDPEIPLPRVSQILAVERGTEI